MSSEQRLEFYRILSKMGTEGVNPKTLKFLRILGLEDKTIFNEILNWKDLDINDKLILLNSFEDIIAKKALHEEELPPVTSKL